MDIDKVLSDKRFIGILNKYYKKDILGIMIRNAGDTPGSVIETMARNIKNPQIIVPVLGMQGIGKSTLINGLLKENILPNEADETTCVPVEIKYGSEKNAKVYFKNGTSQTVPRTIESIASFVDNNNNQGNEKSVRRIELFSESPVLKNGLTIVDLPGVGSLTAQNEETTNKYIENLCTAIFVIPTIPTIRKQEVVFIKSVWSQFPTAVFVQNCWDDESKREIDEAVDYNKKILRRTADELGAQPPDILAINAYKALNSVYSGDNSERVQSGIEALSDKLINLSSQWLDTLEKGTESRINAFIKVTVDIIKEQIDSLELENSEIIKRKENELEEYHENTRMIKRKAEDIEDWLIDKKKELSKFADETVSECVGLIRSQMFELVDKGVTDGENLSNAFKDIQGECLNELSEKVFDKTYEIRKELEENLHELECLIMQANKLQFDNTDFSKDSQFKFEKALPPALGIGGGIVGVIAGAAIGGAIGVIVGGLIGIAASLIGEIGKKLIGKARQSATKNEMAPLFDKMSDELKDKINTSFNQVVKNVEKSLDDMIDNRRKNERKMKDDMDNTEPPVQKPELESDLEYIRSNYYGGVK